MSGACVLAIEPDDALSDFALLLPTGHAVPCHRAILCAASPKLARECLGSSPSPPSSIPCPSEACADAVLRFVYLNRFPMDVRVRDVEPLLDFALEWELAGLVAFLDHRFRLPQKAKRVASAGGGSGGGHWRQWAGTGKHLDFGRLWGRDVFVDVVLALSDACGVVRRVGVSRAVLASRSEFFRSLFARDWHEGKQAEVSVVAPHKLITADLLESCVRAVYGMAVAVAEAPCELLMAAFYLDVDSLLAKCQAHILDHHLSCENVCEMWAMSEEVGTADLSERCKQFVQQNFVRVALSSSFVDLPFDLLHEALVGGDICGPTGAVVELVQRWVRHNKDDERIPQLFPPHTMLTREWKLTLLRGAPPTLFRFAPVPPGFPR